MGKIENAINGLELLKQRLILQADVLGYGYHISDIDDALELLKAKDINVPTKWISVKDRLPTHGEYVLTLDSQGNYYIDQVLRDGRWQETESEWNPVKWWTPLPEPPKEDEA